MLKAINCVTFPCSELSSNVVVDETTQNAITVGEGNVEKMMTDAKSNYSQKNRRSRYLRQTYRRRRRPIFDMQRNVRHPPPHPMYPPRNHFKPARPYPISKFKYRYHRDNWPPKWANQNQAFGPYSAVDEDELEPEPYDEYDDLDEFKNEDLWYTKKYRDGYDDVMPVSSKYSEKRTPTRFPAHFHSGTDYDRGRMRPNYDMYDGWPERNRYTRNYKDYLEMMGAKKYVDGFNDPFPSSRIESHRFKIANGGRFRNDEDDYDFSALSGPKMRRYKTDLSLMQPIRPQREENRYEQEMPDLSKYFNNRPVFPAKTENSQEVVYSAKYRGNNLETKENGKTNQENKADTSQTLHNTNDPETNDDWKRNHPVYQPYLADKTNYGGSETNSARSQSFKSDQLLPSELIAYMSADPAESVVAKEERFLESPFPYDILKTTYPRKISPAIDHDMEITFEDRMSDWKH